MGETEIMRIAVSLARGGMVLALLASVLDAQAAAPAKAFGGEEAAYIDWAFQNCEVIATPKERSLVDAALAAGNAAFQKSYETQYRKIVDQAKTVDQTRALCKSIKGWYGIEGEKEPGLVADKSTKSPLAPVEAGGGGVARQAPAGPASRQSNGPKKGAF